MENFIFYNPTKVIFGKGEEQKTGREIKKYSDKVLLHYGGSNIKNSGLYDKIVNSLKENSVEFVELSGVKPNPRLSLVYEGIKICRENYIDFILAVGGGSVIDSAKAIALGIRYDGDVWDFYKTDAVKIKDAAPLGVVLTIPAAGSETSDSTVLTKEEGWLKRYCNSSALRPKFAILNPEITFTLPKEQTAYGISDILAHGMERYFTTVKNVDFTDRLLEGTFKSLIRNSYLVMEKPDDYAARAEIMWISTVVHNDILGTGRIGDWGSHDIEHELSAIYDVPHGAGLSVIFPAWMKYVYKSDIKRFAQFANRVFGVDAYFGDENRMAIEGIRRLESFYCDIGLPTRLKHLGIGKDRLEEMAEKCVHRESVGKFVKLYKKDVLSIYKLAL